MLASPSTLRKADRRWMDPATLGKLPNRWLLGPCGPNLVSLAPIVRDAWPLFGHGDLPMARHPKMHRDNHSKADRRKAKARECPWRSVPRDPLRFPEKVTLICGCPSLRS